MRTRSIFALAVLAGLGLTAPAAAAQDEEATPPSLTVRTSVKATGLISRSPATSTTVPEQTDGESMLRLRIEPAIRATANTSFSFAYEQRLHYASAPAVGIGVIGILPSELATPFRIEPLVWRVNESAHGAWRHEIDRANAQVHVRRADLTLGRQAIGWGRGVMFTSIDLFAPFSPLEVDREWRSGVDAARADIKLTDRSSIDLVAAFGDTIDRSAFAARARGYAGTVDVEVVGGRRGQDLFGGVTSSAAVGDAEVHGEAAAFRIPSGIGQDVVWKAVVGGSYRVPIGAGILAYAEYHYSGFGANHPEEILALLATPSFAGRFVRGDVQILSRHAIGVPARTKRRPRSRIQRNGCTTRATNPASPRRRSRTRSTTRCRCSAAPTFRTAIRLRAACFAASTEPRRFQGWCSCASISDDGESATRRTARPSTCHFARTSTPFNSVPGATVLKTVPYFLTLS
jgi:hypothetical protein